MSYHLRVTSQSNSNNSKELLKSLFVSYMRKYPIKEYVVGYEEVSDENRHIHAHIVYAGEPPKKQTISDFMKREGYSGLYYHKLVEKDDESNKLYVVKDLDILLHNLSEEELNKLTTKTVEINESKKMQSREKVLAAFVKYMEQYRDVLKKDVFDMNEYEKQIYDDHRFINCITRFIHRLYVREWNKEPPISRIKALVFYVAQKYSDMSDALMNYEREINAYLEVLL